VSVDASASTDNTRIVSYSFACGNGTVIGPTTTPTASCLYTATGRYSIVVTARDTVGQTGSARVDVNVAKK
jgi:hypothetical protein